MGWPRSAPNPVCAKSYLREILSAPSHADQEAETKRQPNGGKGPLRDDVLQRFLDRGGGILSRVHHGAAALRHLVDRLLGVGAGLLVAAARLFGGGAGKTV